VRKARRLSFSRCRLDVCVSSLCRLATVRLLLLIGISMLRLYAKLYRLKHTWRYLFFAAMGVGPPRLF
jgi:hypothetical protein